MILIRHRRLFGAAVVLAVLLATSIITVRNNHHKTAIEYLQKYTRLKVLQILYPERHFDEESAGNFVLFESLQVEEFADQNQVAKFDEMGAAEENYVRENAVIFSLVRNEELYKMLESIKFVEDRFNRKYHYDWVFANEVEFTDTFKQEVSSLVSGEAIFSKIPVEYWSYPDFIDQDKARATRERMEKNKVTYGGSESYRHMCRFNSGFFYKLEELAKYKYYWRVEPEIKINCDIDYDVFKFMRENKKKYGFTMSLHELPDTIFGLWRSTKKFFFEMHKDYIAPDNSIEFVTQDNSQSYNFCHYWSNFEIGDLDFFRSREYEEYFNYLDRAGGFFYERWGDAPVHTLAVSFLLNKDELHYFDNTGYFHSPHTNCPRDPEVRFKLHCTCLLGQDFNWGSDDSCLAYYHEVRDLQRPPYAPNRVFKAHRAN